VLCFRLHFTKDSQAVINTAGATVRQLVSLVFERVMHEDEQREQLLKVCNDDNGHDTQQQKNGVDSSAPSQDQKQQQSSKTQPLPLLHHHNQYNGSNASGYEASAVSTLGPCAADAYHMFQVNYNNYDLLFFMIFLLYPCV